MFMRAAGGIVQKVLTECAEGAIPEEGLEPTRPCGQRILSPPRLPFRHSGTDEQKYHEQRHSANQDQPLDPQSLVFPRASGPGSLDAVPAERYPVVPPVPQGSDAV